MAGGGRLFASGKIIVDGLVRGGVRLFLGVFRFLRDYPLCHKLRLNIVHPRVISDARSCRRVFNSQVWGLEIMMEESSWIEPNSTK